MALRLSPGGCRSLSCDCGLFTVSILFLHKEFFMSEVSTPLAPAAAPVAAQPPAWPGTAPVAAQPPVTQAALANAAARAAASNTRRDLVEYLRLRRTRA